MHWLKCISLPSTIPNTVQHVYVSNCDLQHDILDFSTGQWDNVTLLELGLVVRKPVFGVSDKASFKQVSSATETSWKIEISPV